MGTIGVVMNPGSGHGLAARLEPWIRLRLGDKVDIHKIEPGVDACAWARERAESGCDRIVVIGGDGTFRSIAGALIGTETPVGLIATGTNNNISSTLGLPSDPHEAAEVALAGEPQWVSAGRIGDCHCGRCPEAASAAPAAVAAQPQWNESPQAQDPVAFGLSIVKPCFSIVSTKSMVAPPRYGPLMRSTTTLTPEKSMNVSPSRFRSSKKSW